MKSLKQIRSRINAVKATLKVTAAMQVVAGVKLRKAQARIEASRPYSRRMHWMLRSMHNRYCLDNQCSPLLTGTGSDQKHLYVVFSTDRGLCGGLNANLVRTVNSGARRLEEAGKQLSLICIGKKGYRLLKTGHGHRIIEVFETGTHEKGPFAQVEEIAQLIFKLFERQETDVVCQIYSKFDCISRQLPKAQQLLPIRFARLGHKVDDKDYFIGRPSCAFEPEEQEFFRELLPHYVVSQLYRARLEHMTSEQAARLIAMERASRNARDIIRDQTLAFNKLRQLRITNEINEIVATLR